MQYKNIIFDLGNVLVKLNSLGCMNAFKVLGMEKLIDSNPEAKRLMGELGVGLISTEQFCDAARNLTLTTVSNHQIIEAANRMLVVIPYEKKRRLLKLKAGLSSLSIEQHHRHSLGLLCGEVISL